MNTPLGGSIPIVSKTLLTYSDLKLTSVISTAPHSHTVAFMGTETGQLLKAVLENSSYAIEYARIDVTPNEPILPDMETDLSGQFIFALSGKQVVKLSVNNCEQYQTCSDCLGMRSISFPVLYIVEMCSQK